MCKKVIFFSLLFFLFQVNFSFAASCYNPQTKIKREVSSCPPCGAGEECIKDSITGNSSDSVSLPNPLGKNLSPNQLIGQIINAILGIVGSLALAMFIYGGIIWMTAAGANEKVQKGKDILLWATVGLVVIFTSYAMVKFVLDKVIQGT